VLFKVLLKVEVILQDVVSILQEVKMPEGLNKGHKNQHDTITVESYIDWTSGACSRDKLDYFKWDSEKLHCKKILQIF